MKDFIGGAIGFRDFATFEVMSSDVDKSILDRDGIIFCKTDFISYLFNVINYSSNKYVLITLFSDYHIDKKMFFSKPSCVKRWYAYAVEYKHPDLIQIPAGFGIHFKGFPEVNKELEKWYVDNVERLKAKEKNNKVLYCNYTIDNLRPPRHQIVSKIQMNGIECYIPPNNNTKQGRQTFPDYCEDMANYKFVVSPPGNGIDAHRNWEALYIGCIPIVIKNLIYENYNLPFLIINDYSEITKKLLEDYLEYYNVHEFNYEQYTLSYWKNRMMADLKKI